MALQYLAALRNAQLDQITTVVGASAKMRIYSGSPPADCTVGATGTMLCELDLPSTWMSAASAGSKALTGSWTGTAAATGTAGYFRIYESTLTTCYVQGTVGMGSGDLPLDNTSIAINQTVTVSTFTVSAGNA
jgi:hypothetical protein